MKRFWIKLERFLDVALLVGILSALATLVYPSIGAGVAEALNQLGFSKDVKDANTDAILFLPITFYSIALGLKHLRLFVAKDASSTVKLFSGFGAFLAIQIPIILLFTLRLDAFFLNVISFGIYISLRLHIAKNRSQSTSLFVRLNRPLLLNGVLLLLCFAVGMTATVSQEVTTTNSVFLARTVEKLGTELSGQRDQDPCFENRLRVDTTLMGQAAFFSQSYDGTCAAASAMASVLRVRTHNQNMTVAARAMAERNTVGDLS